LLSRHAPPHERSAARMTVRQRGWHLANYRVVGRRDAPGQEAGKPSRTKQTLVQSAALSTKWNIVTAFSHNADRSGGWGTRFSGRHVIRLKAKWLARSTRGIFADAGAGSFLQLDSLTKEHRDDIFGRNVTGAPHPEERLSSSIAHL
jgi:hypothetical protein